MRTARLAIVAGWALLLMEDAAPCGDKRRRSFPHILLKESAFLLGLADVL